MSPAQLREAIVAGLLTYARKHRVVFRAEPEREDMSDSPKPRTYVNGIVCDVDLTPAWWAGDIECSKAAARVLLDLDTKDEIHGEMTDFTVGVNRVSVRIFWAQSFDAIRLDAWRLWMISRIEEQPGMAERKARWTECQNEKYGTPEEREARRLRTLERLRSCEKLSRAQATPLGE